MTELAKLGHIVIYTLTDGDAEAINRRRVTGVLGDNWPAGAQAHYGNNVGAGMKFPALIVRLWGGSMVNLQVLLDGNDSYWASSRSAGHGPGLWTSNE
jgi:hypothetical protein